MSRDRSAVTCSKSHHPTSTVPPPQHLLLLPHHLLPLLLPHLFPLPHIYCTSSTISTDPPPPHLYCPAPRQAPFPALDMATILSLVREQVALAVGSAVSEHLPPLSHPPVTSLPAVRAGISLCHILFIPARIIILPKFLPHTHPTLCMLESSWH